MHDIVDEFGADQKVDLMRALKVFRDHVRREEYVKTVSAMVAAEKRVVKAKMEVSESLGQLQKDFKNIKRGSKP